MEHVDLVDSQTASMLISDNWETGCMAHFLVQIRQPCLGMNSWHDCLPECMRQAYIAPAHHQQPCASTFCALLGHSMQINDCRYRVREVLVETAAALNLFNDCSDYYTPGSAAPAPDVSASSVPDTDND